MTKALTKAEADLQNLLEAVTRVDVLHTADKVLANPSRHVTSAAGIIAMAIAVKQFGSLLPETDQLVQALALPEIGGQHEDAARDAAVRKHAHEVRRQISEIYGETNEAMEADNAG